MSLPTTTSNISSAPSPNGSSSCSAKRSWARSARSISIGVACLSLLLLACSRESQWQELARLDFPFEFARHFSAADSSAAPFHLEGEFGHPGEKGVWMLSREATLWIDAGPGDYELELRCNASPQIAELGQVLHVLTEDDTLGSTLVPPWGRTITLRCRWRSEAPAPQRITLRATQQWEGHALFLRGLRVHARAQPAGDSLDGIAWELATPTAATDAPEQAPDILLILLDAARPDHFGCYGYERATTPQIDRLAAQGLLLRNAHSTAAYTRAALPSLFSGRSWAQHGVLARDSRLPDDIPTLAELLRAAGYHTLSITTNPEAASASGLERGFVEYHESWRHPERQRLAQAGFFELPATLFGELLPQAPAEQPLFAFLHLIPPHQPYDPGPAHDLWRSTEAPAWDLASNRLLADVDEGRRRLDANERQRLIDLYDGNLHRADAIVGEILRLHAERRPDRERVIVLLSDHGEAFGEHGRYRHSSTVHDEMTRIPLIFWPRERFAALAVREHALTALSDVLPLLLGALGIGLDASSEYPRHLLALHADPGWRRPGIWLHASGEVGLRTAQGLHILRRFGAPELWVDGRASDAAAREFSPFALQLRALRVALPQPGRQPIADVEQLRALGYVE